MFNIPNPNSLFREVFMLYLKLDISYLRVDSSGTGHWIV